MRRPPGSLFGRSWLLFGSLALLTLLGIQSVRAFVPLLVYTLGDRIGWGPLQLGVLAFAVFSVGFLSSRLARLLGRRRALLGIAGGLGVLRLLQQLWTGDPLGDLVLAGIASALFAPALYVLFGEADEGSSSYRAAAITGVLFGLAIDTGLHGMWSTWDVSWRTDPGSLLTVAVPVALLLGFLRSSDDQGCAMCGPEAPGERSTLGLSATPDSPAAPDPRTDHARARFLLALGPFLLLEMLLFQNMARLNVLTGWSTGWSLLLLVAAHGAGIAAVTLTWGRPFHSGSGRFGQWALVVAAGVLILAVLGAEALRGWAAAVPVGFGQVAAAYLVAVPFARKGGPGGHGWPRVGGSTACGAGMVAFALLLFAYYAAYDLALPFSNSMVPPMAAGLLGFLAVAAFGRENGETGCAARDAAVGPWFRHGVLAGVVALLLLSLYGLTSIGLPQSSRGDDGVASLDGPLRVMTFNLHNGFNVGGRLDLEGIARVIERENPHVVILQEVSRGWVVNGSTDMLEWLGRRLGLTYVYGPTTGPLWGNALLSEVPLEQVAGGRLPSPGLWLERGFVVADLPVRVGPPARIIGTHLHHLREEGDVRVNQVRALLDAWGSRERTIVGGDLNAVPEDPEIDLFRREGLVDVWEEAGGVAGYTYPSFAPERRIDYLWVTSDLTVTAAQTTTGTASDHLGVSAVVSPRSAPAR